ncbi:SCO2584 family spore wall biosynthesis protein [Streptomyces purpureus]|uniref:SCO2584 family spore wall biosynthesis protein n=1 Tax=Streptomyces purpureus TaxID=1951 RepID=UPI0003659C11|nr:hypothetical protein [Streptomyces purpureus]
MPDDVGGRPFPDGGDPEESVDRGGADEDFASVVFDEDFVRAAEIHEPTAVERLLAAAQARAEAEAARARSGRTGPEDELYDDHYGHDDRTRERGYDEGVLDDFDDYDESGPYGPHGGALRPYRGATRWHRPVAWVLAVLMGVGMVALAFSAAYRGAAGNRQDRIPAPATTGIDTPGATVPGVPSATRPSASAEYSAPPVPAVPRTP